MTQPSVEVSKRRFSFIPELEGKTVTAYLQYKGQQRQCTSKPITKYQVH